MSEVPTAPTGTDAGAAELIERRVPEAFASGSDRDNAAKAWLHGYDTASQQRGLCSGCGIDRDHCRWAKKRGALACCPDCKHGEYATLDAPPTDAGAAARLKEWSRVYPSEPAHITLARDAVSQLRDAAREGRVLDYRQRDPLVAAIHASLDKAATALAQQAQELKRRETIMKEQRSELMEIKALFGLAAGGVGRSLVEEITFQLAQQATQLQEKDEEIRRLLAAWDNCRTTHESQLTSLRTELEAANEIAAFNDEKWSKAAQAHNATKAQLELTRRQRDWVESQLTSLRAELETAQQAHETALEAVIRERDAEHMEVLAAEYALAEARRAEVLGPSEKVVDFPDRDDIH